MAPGIYRFDHIVVALEDFDAGVAAYSKLFPAGPRETRVNEAQAEKRAFFDLPNAGYVEIVAPSGPGSAIQPHLDKNGPSMVLIAYQCEDLPATVKLMKKNGVEIFEPDPTHAMIYPKSTHGILMKLVEKSPDAPRSNKAGQVPDTSGVTGIVSIQCSVQYVNNVNMAIASYEKLGLTLTFKNENKDGGFIIAGFYFPGGGLIELIGPLDPNDSNSSFAKFMKTQGEGFGWLSLVGSAGAVDALNASGVKMKTTDPAHTNIHKEATLTRSRLFGLLPVLMGTEEQVNMGTALAKL